MVQLVYGWMTMPVKTQHVDELEKLLTLVLEYNYGTQEDVVEPYKPTEEQYEKYKETLDKKEQDLKQHLQHEKGKEQERKDRYKEYLDHLTTGYTKKYLRNDPNTTLGGTDSGTYHTWWINPDGKWEWKVVDDPKGETYRLHETTKTNN